jgi:DNA polymerase-1
MKSDDYVHAIVSGRKEDETDIHNLNRKALGLSHITRDISKTYIYAWLLGAGMGKIASILQTNSKMANVAVNNFYESLPELRSLKMGRIPRDAGRGFFEGLDGRKVICDSEHLMLAGYLQNGEAVVMKHANRLWRDWADKEKILYKQVDFVHDEWQTECHGSLDMAERLGELQRKSIEEVGKQLGIYCPLAGSTDIGANWLATH